MTTYRATIEFNTPRPLTFDERATLTNYMEIKSVVLPASGAKVLDLKDVTPPAPIELSEAQFAALVRGNMIDYDNGPSYAPHLGGIKVVVKK